MIKPGLNRSIPGAILGFAVGAIFVLLLRQAQGLEPVDASVILIVTPLTTTFGWLWGIGAFNPKLSEHAHEEHEEPVTETAMVAVEDDAHAHDEDEEPSPFALLMSSTWTLTTYSLLAFLAVYVLAALPLGLFLQTTSDPAASAAAIDPNMTFDYPLGLGTFQASQLTVFLGFVGFTMVSVLLFGGLLGFLFVQGHQQVAEVEEMEPKGAPDRLPGMFRPVGRASRRVARSLREGLPKLLGQ